MIDSEHPDYRKYKEEFWKLVKEEEEEKANLKKRRILGNDGECNIVHKKYVAKIKKLQEKYRHLFIND